MWGTMPSVQPNAATTLARGPRDSPAASVYSTPIPGDATTISEVMRKSQLMPPSGSFRRTMPESGAGRIAESEPRRLEDTGGGEGAMPRTRALGAFVPSWFPLLDLHKDRVRRAGG